MPRHEGGSVTAKLYTMHREIILEAENLAAILTRMNLTTLVALIGGVVGLIGGVAGILSWFNQRRQTKAVEGQLQVMREQLAVMRDQVNATKKREEADIDWARKFDEATSLIAKISPAKLSTAPSRLEAAYTHVFLDAELRRRIQTYLGRRQWFTDKFIPNILSKEQLQNAVTQQTITDVLDIVGKFKKEHTDYARSLKLL